jgi:hypothetical protein
MNLEEPGERKRIPLAELKPGMHVVELDRPWLETPFVFHRMHIKDRADVAQLEKHGVREVVIELEPSADPETLAEQDRLPPPRRQNGSTAQPAAASGAIRRPRSSPGSPRRGAKHI